MSYQAKTYAERRAQFVAKLRAAPGGLLAKVEFAEDTREGQIVNRTVEALTDLDEAAAASDALLDPAKVPEAGAEATARLRGTLPREASYGTVVCTADLDAGTYAAGSLIAFVIEEPGNRWINQDEIVSAGGEVEDLIFVAESAGSEWTAPLGTLTEMVSVAGWNSITNTSDAVAGRDADSPATTLLRSEALFFRTAQNGNAAIRAAVLDVDGVVDAYVYTYSAGNVRVVVWDGVSEDADEDEIATAIWSKLSPGCGTIGAIENLSLGFGVNFDRATLRSLYAEIDVVGSNIDEDEVKSQSRTALPGVLGGTVHWAKMVAAVLDAGGVTDVSDLFLDDVDPPVQTGDNFTAAADEWLELAGEDIVVNS